MFKKFKGFKQKLVIFALIGALLLPVFSQTTLAFESGPNSSYPFQFWNAVFRTDEMNLQSFVYETMRATITSIITLIIGRPANYQDMPVFDTIRNWVESQLPNLVQGGGGSDSAVAQVGQFMASLYANPPASGISYMAQLGQKLNLVSPAYAQTGVGWIRMQTYLPLWKAFRNVAYVFFVLIIVFMGFAIMFRLKISPQAVVTIQSAIPRVVLGLILITFSYAIVGFMIDIMYVAINLALSIFADLNVFTRDLIGVGTATFPTTDDATLFTDMFLMGLVPLTLLLAVLIIAGTVILILSGPLAPVAMFVGLIIAAIFLLALLRVCWTLIKAYVNVVLALIFGPIMLLVGTLPGNKAIGSWFRNLIANLAVWPTVIIMVYLAGFICLSSVQEVIDGPPAASELFRLLILLPIIAIGILLMTPKAADMIKSFMAGQPFQYGTAIGQAFGVGGAIGMGGVQYGVTSIDEKYQAAQRAALTGGQPPGTGLKVGKAIGDVLKTAGKVK